MSVIFGDPGVSGALVHYEAGRVLAWCVWQVLRRKRGAVFRWCESRGGLPVVYDSIGGLYGAIWRWVDQERRRNLMKPILEAVSIEKTFHRRGRPAIELHRHAGALEAVVFDAAECSKTGAAVWVAPPMWLSWASGLTPGRATGPAVVAELSKRWPECPTDHALDAFGGAIWLEGVLRKGEACSGS